MLGMKALAWYIDPNGIENKITNKYPYPIGIKEKSEILILVTRMVLENRDTKVDGS